MTGDTLTIARVCFFFFFNDTATTEIYTLSLHDALPIYGFVIHLEGSRHPVVERMMPREAFIPNDVLLDEAARIIVLTGPNMAGKPPLLRQGWLCGVLAQMGAFVPARRAAGSRRGSPFARVRGPGPRLGRPAP